MKTESQHPNILITIDWFLPGTKAGGPVRSVVNMIEQLGVFNFYIITRNTDYCSTQPYADVTSDAWTQFSSNTWVYYFSAAELDKHNMENVINSIDCSVIYINGIYSKWFSRLPLKIAQKLNLKTVIATRGMLSPHALAVKSFKKHVFLAVQNALKTYKNVHFHVTHADEKADVESVIVDFQDISIIPNLSRTLDQPKPESIPKLTGEVKLIGLGRIAEEKGTLISLNALQHIKGKVCFDLYGTIYDEVYWKKCQQAIDNLPPNIEVNYKGNLDSDQVIQILSQYHFLLLPSKGENYGHAIVESFIANRPVVISKQTPWKDLKAKNIGYDVEETELHQILQNIVDMPDEVYQNMATSIYKNIENTLDINTIQKQYRELFK